MEAIRELLLSPVFWFASVAVALLINVVSTYATRWLDRRLTLARHWSRSLFKRNAASSTDAAIARFLDSHPDGCSLLYLHANSLMFDAAIFYGVGCAALATGAYFDGRTPLNWLTIAALPIGTVAAIYGMMINTAAQVLRHAVTTHPSGTAPLFAEIDLIRGAAAQRREEAR